MSLTACKVSVVWIGGYLVFFLTLISVQCILVFGRVGKRVRLHLLQTARKNTHKTQIYSK